MKPDIKRMPGFLFTIFSSVIRLYLQTLFMELHQAGAKAETQEKDIRISSLLGETVSTERNRLFDFIRRRVRTAEDAEDILQDVFYQLVTSYSVAEPIEKLAAWLFTVARNKITDWYRKRRTESPPATTDDDSLPLNLEDILFDPADNPAMVYERSLVWTELADALDEMPESQREVFVMHELEGRSFKEIAAITGEGRNTLLSRKRYAVLFLRERLQELYNEFQFE